MTNPNKLADALRDILDYTGGADSALADHYVMDRAHEALADYDKALAAPPAPAADHADTKPNGKLVGWWNGIEPGVDGEGNVSVRWGADAEDGRHDIPLYDGYNPIHYVTPQPAPVQVDDFDCPHSALDACDCYAPAPVQVDDSAFAGMYEDVFPDGARPPAPAADGAGELDTAAIAAGHITFDSMKQCADAWFAIVDLLNKLVPNWMRSGLTGHEAALEAIAALRQPVPDAVRELPLTASVLADALECFWNASLSAARERQDSTAYAATSCAAEGFAAVAMRLHEHAAIASQQESHNG